MKQISSVSNPEIKHLVKLHTTKERREAREFIIEGWRAISTAIEAGLKIKKLYTTEDLVTQAKEIITEKLITTITENIIHKISSLKSPSGIVAIFELPEALPISKLSPGVVLAQISDPGNMGTLIRTAAACGLKTVIVIEGADPWSPKVVQASAGTIALVNIYELDWQTLIKSKNNLKLCGLVVHSGNSPRTISPNNSLLVIGSEAHGLPQEWQNECDQLITLPMPGKTESLNAAIAGSIALYFTFVKL